MNIKAIADSTIPKATNKKVLKNKAGETRDIIKEVLECYAENRLQLKKFAPYLQGHTVLETCRNIWQFWKENIRYQVDADGVQWIKTPAAVWATKFCDCKSFSVAVACTLDALGIDGKFRFASYGSNYETPTHVYVVAMHQGKEIIIDCVWTGFNSQKPYTKNWDYNMTSIFRISGFEPAAKKFAVGELNIDVNDPHTTQAELDAALDLQRLELEQKFARRKHAVGSVHDTNYQIEIEGHKAALGAIGLFRSKKKKLAIAVKKNDGKGVNKKQAKLLAKAGVAVKKTRDSLLKRVAKGITKVITTPIRLAAKTQLPKNAPFFLYLFITDPKVLAKLPQSVQVKRQKALKFKSILVDKLQMKESNFTSIIRNGIMTNLGDTPENILAKWMKDGNFIAGIGVIPAALMDAAGVLKSLLGKFGENLAADVEQFTPAPEDWGGDGMTVEQRNAMAFQQAATQANPMVYTNSNGTYTTPTSTNTPTDNTADWIQTESGWLNRATGETSLNDPKLLDNVTVEGKRSIVPGDDTLPDETDGGNNTMLYLGIAAVAVLALSSKGGKKQRN